MSSPVKCVLCNTVLTHSSGDTGNLIQHLREYHQADSTPRIENNDHESNIEHTERQDNLDHHDCTVNIFDATASPESTQTHSSSEKEISLATSRDCLRTKLIYQPAMDGRKKKVLYSRVYRPKKSFRSYRHVSYRTIVESWRTGSARITCPACGNCRIPVVRSQLEHDTRSSAWATCLLFCWPFCCIPCCFQTPKREYLHCSKCDACLATYDFETDCVQPNFELFEAG